MSKRKFSFREILLIPAAWLFVLSMLYIAYMKNKFLLH